MLANLVGMMLKFRQEHFVLMADFEKAFLQIQLKSEEDKNKFCFLWESNGELKVYRHRTILFGLNASPFVLMRVLQYHLNLYQQDAVADILRTSFYIDDFLFTSSDTDQILKV